MLPKICSIPECETKTVARGWCNTHYARWHRHGSPLIDGRLTECERFWSKVNKTHGCWYWTGSKSEDGYGHFRIRRDGEHAMGSAHRRAWEMLVGPIPQGLSLDHICHNKSCVNPDHLRPVTVKQNGENRIGADTSNKSGVRGVSWNAARRKWRAMVGHHNQIIYLGAFDTIAKAEAVVVAKRLELFTHNDIDRKVNL